MMSHIGYSNVQNPVDVTSVFFLGKISHTIMGNIAIIYNRSYGALTNKCVHLYCIVVFPSLSQSLALLLLYYHSLMENDLLVIFIFKYIHRNSLICVGMMQI